MIELSKSITKFDYQAAQKIRRRFLEQVQKDLRRWDEERPSGIHVTAIVSPCLRWAYYDYFHEPETDLMDIDIIQRISLWIGKRLHMMAVTEGWETEVMISDPDDRLRLIGSIDEIDGDILYDKKFVKRVPPAPYEQHIRQVMAYVVLLCKYYNRCVKKAGILYVSKSAWRDSDVQAYVWDITPELYKQAEQMVEERYQILRRAIETKTPPPAEPGDWCRWCSWRSRCRTDNLKSQSADPSAESTANNQEASAE